MCFPENPNPKLSWDFSRILGFAKILGYRKLSLGLRKHLGMSKSVGSKPTHGDAQPVHGVHLAHCGFLALATIRKCFGASPVSK
eukprot:1567603-Alexandrium_andersonii.AAC.1